jgi:hypothetical protein
MDPGNWVTDIAGGAKYGHALLSVIAISNLLAIFLQTLSLRLGIATGRDLAQLCRDQFSLRALSLEADGDMKRKSRCATMTLSPRWHVVNREARVALTPSGSSVL